MKCGVISYLESELFQGCRMLISKKCAVVVANDYIALDVHLQEQLYDHTVAILMPLFHLQNPFKLAR